eukprot:GHRQ01012347.1.p1 GENE.GHRQ01012347.1~~GHRQ01012347.1.p1  ORF type:complete len:242 (+),score=61.91 GHRQ01012347.1:518-1243(+)
MAAMQQHRMLRNSSLQPRLPGTASRPAGACRSVRRIAVALYGSQEHMQGADRRPCCSSSIRPLVRAAAAEVALLPITTTSRQSERSRSSSVAAKAAPGSRTPAGTLDPAAVPLQVTRSNFTAVLPAVRQALQDCQFFSYDCEMTGLFLQGQDDYLVDDVTDRYIKAAAAAEQFRVVQFGLSAFVWRPESNSYSVRSFNFHLFPSPQEDLDARFMCQASSLAFLASQGFDFNKVRGLPQARL